MQRQRRDSLARNIDTLKLLLLDLLLANGSLHQSTLPDLTLLGELTASRCHAPVGAPVLLPGANSPISAARIPSPRHLLFSKVPAS